MRGLITANLKDQFTYLGSTVTSNLSFDAEISKRIAKAATVMAKLNKRVWGNNQLMVNTKLKVHQACVLSTLLYGSETWSTYIRQENRLESFHLRCLLAILSITWRDKVTNTEVLEKAVSLSMRLMLCQHRLRWLGHVHRMDDGHIPKDLLYVELAMGHRPMLRLKDVCKRDMKLTDIDSNSWELVATDRGHWRHVFQEGVKRGEEKRNLQLEDKRQWRKQRQQNQNQTSYQPSDFVCNTCGRLSG